MNYLKTKKENTPMVSAIFFSLLIHSAVGAILVFCLSNNFIVSPLSNKLNLVWVSLNNKSASGREEGRATQLPLDVKGITAQPANIEKPAPEKETAPIPAAIVSKNSAITTVPVKYDASVTKVKEQSDNITGYSSNKSTDKISTLNNVIAYPLYKENEPPVYPEIARVRGYEGVVLVSAEVLPNGRVGEIKIRKSSGYAILDQSALQAVKPWKFEPAKKSGDPFTAWVELPIKFILHNNSQS